MFLVVAVQRHTPITYIRSHSSSTYTSVSHFCVLQSCSCTWTDANTFAKRQESLDSFCCILIHVHACSYYNIIMPLLYLYVQKTRVEVVFLLSAAASIWITALFAIDTSNLTSDNTILVFFLWLQIVIIWIVIGFYVSHSLVL